MKKRISLMIMLHIILMIYSLGGICSKLAAQEDSINIKFCIYYILIFIFLFIYAIGWQQVIKKMPLSIAFSNKAVTVVWGMIWGFMIFKEPITIGKVIGAFFVIIGVVIYSKSDGEQINENRDI